LLQNEGTLFRYDSGVACCLNWMDSSNSVESRTS
jgi:hypothetical protein